jgi:hypothetical protein
VNPETITNPVTYLKIPKFIRAGKEHSSENTLHIIQQK